MIPIVGPLAGTFTGKVGGGLDLGFGYDTRGLNQFLATDNPAFLLNGFFLSDYDPATGAERPEAFFSAEIAVGATLSIGPVSAGVEGGIRADIEFDLADLDGDHKIRAGELAANLLANSYNPIAIFDVEGIISFFLRAFVELNLGIVKLTKEFEFLTLELFSFEILFERPPILAVQSGTDLMVNIGPNADGRLNGNTDDIAETVFVKGDSGTVTVWSPDLGVDESTADASVDLYRFFNVHRVIVMGGEGNDVIDASRLNNTVVAELHGGTGNDILIGGDAADELFGDEGDDILIGWGNSTDGRDILRGGRDDDKLFGDNFSGLTLPAGVPANGGAPTNPAIDELFGDEGDDILDGGADDDIVDSGPGNDEVIRSAGNDQILLASAGSTDVVSGNAGDPIPDLTDKAGGVSVFVQDGAILIGFGGAGADGGADPVQTVLEANISGLGVGTVPDYFVDQIYVADATNVAEIRGSDGADVYYVQDNPTSLVLDGGSGPDKYFFYTDSGTITATVEDEAALGLGQENLIQVIGGTPTISSTADTITVTNSTIGFGASVVTYVPPPGGVVDSDQLLIKILGRGGDDTVTVESTRRGAGARRGGGG